MARCKDCIHGEVCDIFAHIRTLICNDNADKMCKMFKLTADVVPKSEVDSWKEVAETNMLVILNMQDELTNAKANVATEIFEKIEEALFNNHCVDDGTDYPTPHYFEELKDDIAELKKKHTEGAQEEK